MAENEKILNLDPEDMNAHTMMGDVFSKKNESAKAFEEYLKAVEDFNNRGQIDKIAPLHQKIIQLDPNQLGPAALQKLGLIQLSLRADGALAENKTEEAAEALGEILKSDPEDMTVTAKLAELEEKLGRMSAAVEHYSRLGESFFKSRLLKKAQEIFRKVTALDPQNISARSNMAQIYLKQGSENEAKKEYLNIAEQALANRNPDAALEYAKMAVELKSIEAHYFMGIVLFEHRNWTEAKAAFDNLLRFKPQHVGALVYLGKVYDETDQPSKAVETFQKALKIEKDNLPALEAWANYCVKKKDKSEAVQTLTLLISRADAANDPERAVQWARTLISVDETLKPSKLKLAEALEKNNDPLGAADVYHHLALTHSRQNQADDAARYTRKTLELNPNHAGALAMAPAPAEPPAPSSASPAPVESRGKEEIIPPAPAAEVSGAEAFKAQLDVADQYVKDGLLEEAIDIYQQLTEINPDHREVQEKLNRVYTAYAKTGADFMGAAEPEIIEAAATSQDSPRADVSPSPSPELEAKVRAEADEKAAREKAIRDDAEKKIREEVEKRIREEEEKKVRQELENQIRRDIERKVRARIEQEQREEAEKKIREDAEKKAREEEAQKKAREAAERKIRDEIERKAREEAQRKSLNEIQRKISETIEKKTREVAEKKAREAAETREKLEAERKVREEVERKVRGEMERQRREEAEKKIRESVERQVREEAEKNVRHEVERRTREELEKQFRDDDKKKAREEAKKKIQDVMNRKTGGPGETAAPAVQRGALPVLKLIEPSAPLKPAAPSDSQKEPEMKKRNNKIGYL